MTTGKTIALTIWTFVSRVMSLLYNALSLPGSNHFPAKKQFFDFMAAVTVHSDFGVQKHEICHYFHLLPFYSPCIYGAGCHDISFLGLFVCLFFSIFSLKPALSLYSFILIRSLFSFSLLLTIRVVSPACQRLLMFLPLILLSACNSSRLNKQGDSRQPCSTPFSILNQSIVPCRVLTVAS